jgi:hypothetical protein
MSALSLVATDRQRNGPDTAKPVIREAVVTLFYHIFDLCMLRLSRAPQPTSRSPRIYAIMSYNHIMWNTFALYGNSQLHPTRLLADCDIILCSVTGCSSVLGGAIQRTMAYSLLLQKTLKNRSRLKLTYSLGYSSGALL